MWFTIVSVIYVLVCAFLIMVVLLQQGKGGGMGSAFGGGGGSNTVFGGAGAGNFLTRLTAIAATLFMVLSALLAYMSTSGEREFDVVEEVEAEQNEDTIGGDGSESGDEEASADDEADSVPLTTEEAIEQEVDDALDELEEDLGDEEALDEPVGEEPAADEPAANEPAEPEAEAPAPAPARAPAAEETTEAPAAEPEAAEAPPSPPIEEEEPPATE